MNPPSHTTPDSPAPERRVRLTPWIALAAGILVVAWYAGAAPRWRGRHAADLRAIKAGPAYVLVARPSATNAAEAPVFPAEMRPWTDAPIHPRATGYVRRWNADIGARVRAGDTLAEIDAPELEQDLARARADLAHAAAATGLAKTTAARWQDLLRTAGVSEQETAEKVADLALKQAAEESARASVRRLEQLVAFTRVAAPFDGTITARRLDVGELVTAGSGRELFHLADTTRLRISVRVPQPVAVGLAPGQAAELLPGDVATRVFPVRVARTAGQLDAATRTLLVEFEFDNTRGEVLAGSFARVRFPDNRPEPALTVPANALIFHAEGPQVAVVGDDGRVRLRRVLPGRDLGPAVEIRSGVTPSDRVVVNPSDSLHDGQEVQVREPEPAKPTKP